MFLGEITRNQYHETERYYEIDWTIKNFFSYTKVDYSYHSPTFSAGDSEWFFEIFPNGTPQNSSVGWLDLYLRKCMLHPNNSVYCSFGLRKLDGTVEKIGENNNFVLSDEDAYCREAKILDRSKLESSSSNLAPGGSLTITCILTANQDFDFTSIYANRRPEMSRTAHQFIQTMSSNASNSIENSQSNLATSEEIGEITQELYHEIEGFYEIDWTIKNILSYTENDKCYLSPDFSAGDSKWCFRIYPNGQTGISSDGWLDLYLLRVDGNSKTAYLCLGLRKLTGTVEKMYECNNNCILSREDERYGKDYFLKRSELEENKSILAPSGALTVTCSLRVIQGSNLGSRLMDLSTDLKKLFTSKKGCDATLRVQNEEFPVHRGILASRSPVFESMFEAEMKEKETGVVDIVDCHPGAFRDFLVFIYSGMFENSSGDIFELYKIAHKYCTDQLKEICVSEITSNITVDTVIDVAILGHQFDEEPLKNQSQKFFDENFAVIFPTDKWKSLLRKNPTLANELLMNMTAK